MTEGTYYLASGILGLVGLVVLSWYAWLTRRISLRADSGGLERIRGDVKELERLGLLPKRQDMP